VVLSLEHETIPASLHFKEPNPHVPWSELAVSVVTERTEWKRGARPRRAGVSSFGISGTNAHVIVEEAPLEGASAAEGRVSVLPVSARGAKALEDLVGRYALHLREHGGIALADACRTAGQGRTHFEERLAVVARTREELTSSLEKLARGESVERTAR